jgi:hypothetical protein
VLVHFAQPATLPHHSTHAKAESGRLDAVFGALFLLLGDQSVFAFG